MMRYGFAGFFLSLLLLGACSGKADPEVEGEAYLNRARVALEQKRFADAKQEVLNLRQEVPTAINSREMGIILMDSIDLMQAQEDLRVADSSVLATPKDRVSNDQKVRREEATQRVRFFSLKLEHDLNNLTRH